MDDNTLRNVVADALEEIGHGSAWFIAEIRAGKRDDCPMMQGARWANAAWLANWQPAPEAVEE